MSSFNQNVKILRKAAGYTQASFAEALGIKRSQIGSYEEGRAEPKIEVLIQMAKLLGKPLEALMVNPKANSVAPEAKQEFGSSRILAITLDESGEENVECVPQKAAAGYLNGYSDPQFIAELPRMKLPQIAGIGAGTFRAFELKGDSMLPLPSGTVVISRYVDSLNEIKNGRTYVIVSETEGVVYKRVFNYSEEKGTLYLVSDNKQYASFEVPVSDVKEIWAAAAYLSTDFPQVPADEKLGIEDLGRIVKDLQHEVNSLRENQAN